FRHGGGGSGGGLGRCVPGCAEASLGVERTETRHVGVDEDRAHFTVVDGDAEHRAHLFVPPRLQARITTARAAVARTSLTDGCGCSREEATVGPAVAAT